MSRLSYSPGTTGVFRASALQREYRRVLDCAREGPVQVLDKDDTLLGVERWEDLVFARGVVAALDDVGRFHAVHNRHNAEPAGEWAAMTGFPWLAHFDSEDVGEFAASLLPSLFESLQAGTLEPYLGNLRSWESSTELLDDPAMVEALRVDLSQVDLVEIYPPAEQSTESAAVDVTPADER